MNLKYEDKQEAEVVAASLSPDNDDYIDIEIKGSKLKCWTKAETPKKLLHTIDDFLACVTVAEETLKEK